MGTSMVFVWTLYDLKRYPDSYACCSFSRRSSGAARCVARGSSGERRDSCGSQRLCPARCRIAGRRLAARNAHRNPVGRRRARRVFAVAAGAHPDAAGRQVVAAGGAAARASRAGLGFCGDRSGASGGGVADAAARCALGCGAGAGERGAGSRAVLDGARRCSSSEASAGGRRRQQGPGFPVPAGSCAERVIRRGFASSAVHRFARHARRRSAQAAWAAVHPDAHARRGATAEMARRI